MDLRCYIAIPAGSVVKFFFASFVVIAFVLPFFPQGGRRDPTFNQLMSADADIRTIELQPDGKILVGGRFTTLAPGSRHDLIRLNADGTIDQTFDAGTGTGDFGWVFNLAVQPDGKIMVAGYFNSFNGTGGRSLVRLNSNGSVDNAFNLSGLDVTFAFDVALQPDGKVYITASNLIGSSFVARFTSTGANDGSVGQQFYNFSGSSGYLITYLPGESKLLTSALTFGTGYQGFVRKVLPTGGPDNAFEVTVNGASGTARLDTRLMPGGKYLVFGKFETINSVPRHNIAVVDQDGTIDASFVPAASGSDYIFAAAVQADGKILIGGTGFAPNGQPQGNLGRLNADGSIDRTFNAGRGANLSVKALQIVGGKLFVGGDFFRYDRYPTAGFARIRL